MNNSIVLVNIDKLKCHEEVVEEHVEILRRQMMEDGRLKRPIIVDKNSLVILDGHHRFTALKRMGYKKIPVQVVDYNSQDVRVYLRRKELMIELVKEAVLKKVKDGKLFPSKTTRHLIKGRIGKINYSIKNLGGLT